MARVLLIALLSLALSGCSLCGGWFWEKDKPAKAGLFASGCDR